MMPGSDHSIGMLLTPDHVGRVYRTVERPSERTDNHLTPLSDVEKKETARHLAHECHGGPLWLFVYGSLLWKPAFDHLEKLRAVVYGWRRAFCLSICN